MTVIDYQKRGQEPVKELRSTEAYDDFEARLKDKVGKARIQARIQRLALETQADAGIWKGVSELKIDFGPGYRVYFAERVAGTIVILLAGGDKSTQDADIRMALPLADELDWNF